MIHFIKTNLFKGNYEDIANICKDMDADKIRDILITIAYDSENISVYSFVLYMIKKTENAIWIELAVDIMMNPLCFIEGAYSVALFHSRELLFMKRSIRNLERILFFYNIPEKLVDKEEAQLIAQEILKKDPQNLVALKI